MNKKYFALDGYLHYPHRDNTALDAFLDFLARKRIETISLNGDI